MEVRVISWSEPRLGVIHTMELSPFEIPRKDDMISFGGVEYTVHHVTWRYDIHTNPVMLTTELPPGSVTSIRLDRVDMYV